MKACTKCRVSKPLTSFHTRKEAPDGHRNECRDCQRAYKQAHAIEHSDELRAKRRAYHKANQQHISAKVRLWRLVNVYGISEQEYARMRAAQNNLCALCKSPEKSKRLCVDHDHETGEVRGLLCIQCNSALGKLGDNIAGLDNAKQYLLRALLERHLPRNSDKK